MPILAAVHALCIQCDFYAYSHPVWRLIYSTYTCKSCFYGNSLNNVMILEYVQHSVAHTT